VTFERVFCAVPDEFSFDPVSKTYGEPQRRPEIRSSTIEFIAPSEYMVSYAFPDCRIKYLCDKYVAWEYNG